MNQQKFLVISLLIFGMVFPFIDSLVVFETFYLLIPLIILLFASIAVFIGYLIWNRAKLKQSFLLVLVIPLFIAAQFFSTWTIDKIQRFRSEHIIEEIENAFFQTGQIPHEYSVGFGIKFSKLPADNEFRIEYSRGFMVTEVYYSKGKIWKSRGWND